MFKNIIFLNFFIIQNSDTKLIFEIFSLEQPNYELIQQKNNAERPNTINNGSSVPGVHPGILRKYFVF